MRTTCCFSSIDLFLYYNGEDPTGIPGTVSLLQLVVSWLIVEDDALVLILQRHLENWSLIVITVAPEIGISLNVLPYCPWPPVFEKTAQCGKKNGGGWNPRF
jgi:hypothetical protein